MNDKELSNRFVHHPPKDNEQTELYAANRAKVLDLARHINAVLPECREQSLALTKLEECLFFCNAAIARHF